MDLIFNWIISNYVELLGSIMGIAYVLLASKENILCWLVGIISVGLYIAVFFTAKLYGDMALQVFYLIMGIYGWYSWHNGKQNQKVLEITKINLKLVLVMFVFIVFMTFGFGFILSYTDNSIPYWDGLTTALGLAGTWMTARKYLESWLLWIFANIVCVGIYYYKGLHPTVVFYAIMTLLAYRGYNIWNQNYLKKI